MELSTRKKQVARIGLLFTLAYMVSYLTRINFGAVISEMESDTGISRKLLSLSLTGSFVTYGIGQILSGILGDKISPKKLISLGFLATTLMNIAIPFCKSPYLMLAAWCINGFAQSLMWPPMVKLMSAKLTDEEYTAVSIKVSWGAQIGTILIYLISPLFISLSGWRAVFVFSSVTGALMLLAWNKFAIDIPRSELKTTEKRRGGARMLLSPVVLAIMLAIVLQGSLRDGIQTWTPTYVSNIYGLTNEISILTGVILPIFAVLCFEATSLVYGKLIKNPVFCAGILFAGGLLSSVGLSLSTGKNAVLSLIFLALLSGFMHGVNLLLVCMVPAAFKKYGNVGAASGIINSCTYVGSAVSTYGIALLSEDYGWDLTILVWVAIALVGTSICLICSRPWKKKFMNEKE